MKLGLKWLKTRILVWKFDRGVDLLILETESSSENFNSSVMSFMTCVQNLRSIELNLIGFDIERRSWKFLRFIRLESMYDSYF